ALAVPVERHRPRTERAQLLLEVDADALRKDVVAPLESPGVALKTVAPEKLGLGFHVAESWYVDAIRPVADDATIEIPRNASSGAATLDMVHDIASHLATRIRDAGMQQKSRAL